MMDLKNKKLFLLDMDGTLYLGDRLFPYTLNFLDSIKRKGGRYVFVTNNSSKGTDAYVRKLEKLGISANEEDFVTSTDATVFHIQKAYRDVLFYVMGTKTFFDTLQKANIRVTNTLERYDDIGGVILSNDTELTFGKLNDVSMLLSDRNKDLVYLATNPDWVCPTEYGYVPDCGSFADILHRATGKSPVFIGKPKPDMILTAIDKFGYEKEACLVIGDRLYTDIASGVNAGVDTAFVLSGEGKREDLEKSSFQPTYVFANVGDLIDCF